MRVGLALKGYHVTKETSLQEMVTVIHTLSLVIRLDVMMQSLQAVNLFSPLLCNKNNKYEAAA